MALPSGVASRSVDAGTGEAPPQLAALGFQPGDEVWGLLAQPPLPDDDNNAAVWMCASRMPPK